MEWAILFGHLVGPGLSALPVPSKVCRELRGLTVEGTRLSTEGMINEVVGMPIVSVS